MNLQRPEDNSVSLKHWIWFVSLLGAVFLLAYTDVWDLDIYYHLATGRAILDNKGWLDSNIFIYTGAGQTFYPNAAWLFELLVYPIHARTGFTGLVLFKALLLLLLFALLWRLLLEKGVSFRRVALLLFVIAMACAFRFTERPHLFSHLFLAIFVLLTERHRRGVTRALWWLPPVMLLWANVHAGFIFGLLYLWLIVGAEGVKLHCRSVPQWLQGSPLTTAQLRQLGLVTLAVTAVSFLNPTPLANFRSLWELVHAGEVFPITEYDSPDPAVLPWFFALLALLALLAFFKPRQHDPTELAPLLCFLVLAFSAVRFIPDFAIVALPWAGSRLAGWKRPVLQAGRLRRLAWAGDFGIPLLLVATALFFPPGPAKREIPVAPPYEAPLAAANFLKSVEAKGNLYNSMSVCGVAMFHLFPAYPLYQTSYFQVEKQTIGEAFRAGKDPATWGEFLRRRQVEIVWLDLGTEPHTPDYYPPQQWALVYFDDLSAIFLRRGGQNDALIARHEYRVVHPSRVFAREGEAIVDLERLDEGEAELRRALNWNPQSPMLHLMLGLYLNAAAGREEEALRQFSAAVTLGGKLGPEIAPSLAPALYQQGVLLIGRGDISGAVDSLRRYVELVPEDPLGYGRLAAAYALQGEAQKGIKVVRGALRRFPENGDLYYSLGLLLRESGDLDGSLASFQAAQRLLPQSAVVLNDLGVIIGMKGDLPQAIQIFERALAMQPGYAEALRNRQYAEELLRRGGRQ